MQTILELGCTFVHCDCAESKGLIRRPDDGDVRALEFAELDEIECPTCGTAVPLKNDPPQNYFFRPWSIAHGRKAVKAFVESLGEEAHEWLLVLFADRNMNLLAVDTVAQGDVGNCPVPFWKIVSRAKALRAEGFVLVHNHPSGDSTPSRSDVQVTRRLHSVSKDLDIVMLDHLIVARGKIFEIGEWYWEDNPYARTIPQAAW